MSDTSTHQPVADGTDGPDGPNGPDGPVPGLDAVLSEEGWVYASTPSTGPGDPGRFHALFGRDSLITALQLLPVRPDIARATLRALAARQGTRVDTGTLEAPGKIGHEFRAEPPAALVAEGWPGRGEFRYFATADATSWFLVLLDRLGDRALIDELRPNWERAAGWLADTLDAGDGLLWHAPGRFPGSLVHQGWRDATDPTRPGGGGTLRPDGTAPRPPLADADTQAVTVAALEALARLTGEAQWARRADRLRAAVTAHFLPEVVMLEAGGRAVPGAGSQLGWLLWAGALEPSAVSAAAARLARPDIRTPFGLRTLADTAPVFAPDAYHRGAIWPFDSWLGWGGLRAAGLAEEAEQVRTGVLAAIQELGGYPELYGVTAATAGQGAFRPMANPQANRVQAWTVGAEWALTHRWDARVQGL